MRSSDIFAVSTDDGFFTVFDNAIYYLTVFLRVIKGDFSPDYRYRLPSFFANGQRLLFPAVKRFFNECFQKDFLWKKEATSLLFHSYVPSHVEIRADPEKLIRIYSKTQILSFCNAFQFEYYFNHFAASFRGLEGKSNIFVGILFSKEYYRAAL